MRNGSASNGADALEKLRCAASADDPYDVAIIDLFMPQMDGYELAKVIRREPGLAALKLILVTAFDTKGRGTQALQAGYNSYLTKPVKQSQLFDCIAGVINDVSEHPNHRADGPTRKRERSKSSNPVTGSMHQVLVAEDNAINQKLVLAQLRKLGVKPDVVSNGREAFEASKSHEYKLIFMDCQMPEMDGFETTRLIRKAESRTGRHVPIIALTANAMEGDRDTCIAAGMDDYLSKPLDLKKLQRHIERWLPELMSQHELQDRKIN
jgi:CheY-like chemotaxis protein